MISNRTKLKIAAVFFLIETVLLFYFSVASLPAAEPAPGLRLGDMEHFVAYLIYGILAERVLSYTKFRNHRWSLALLIAVAVGGLNEVIQAFVPGRVTDVLDFAYDGAGAIVGVTIFRFLKN